MVCLFYLEMPLLTSKNPFQRGHMEVTEVTLNRVSVAQSPNTQVLINL